MPTLVEIGPLILKKILQFCQCLFSIFVIISSKKRGVALHLNKLECPLRTDALCHYGLYKIGLLVLKKKIFQYCHCIFAYL